MIMVIASAAGIGDARARLERALIPEPATFSEVGLSINLWITPPAYTGLAPIFLENAAAKHIVSAEAMTGREMASLPNRDPRACWQHISGAIESWVINRRPSWSASVKRHSRRWTRSCPKPARVR